MTKIRSTIEIVMKKANEIPDDIIDRHHYRTEGNRLAVRYMNGEDCILDSLDYYAPDSNERRYFLEGIKEILNRHITIPKGDKANAEHIMKNDTRALRGFVALKTDKQAVVDVKSEIVSLFKQYLREKKSKYNALKEEIETAIQGIRDELKEEHGQKIADGIEVLDPEQQPEFEKRWIDIELKLNLKYNEELDKYKKQLLEIK